MKNSVKWRNREKLKKLSNVK